MTLLLHPSTKSHNYCHRLFVHALLRTDQTRIVTGAPLAHRNPRPSADGLIAPSPTPPPRLDKLPAASRTPQLRPPTHSSHDSSSLPIVLVALQSTARAPPSEPPSGLPPSLPPPSSLSDDSSSLHSAELTQFVPSITIHPLPERHQMTEPPSYHEDGVTPPTAPSTLVVAQ